jgi:putative hydrolase of the HAD superfamily
MDHSIEHLKGQEAARAENDIRAVILDYGHVLAPAPTPAQYRALQDLSGLEQASFKKLYWLNREEYDRHALDGPAYWRQIAARAGLEYSASQIEQLILHDIALWTEVDPEMLAWVTALKAGGIRTAVLSNMPRDLSSHLRRSAAWLQSFDHCVFSGELELLKPQPAIYQACLEGLGVRPGEALFIDDRLPNVEGARAVGMRGLLFESLPQLANDVRLLGLPAVKGGQPDEEPRNANRQA